MKQALCLLHIVIVALASQVFGLTRPVDNSAHDPRSDCDADHAAEVAATAGPPRAFRKTAEFAISTFNQDTVKKFADAWAQSKNGTTSVEGVVLVFRMADGSYSAKSLGSSNEYKKRTFDWQPGIIAIVHTHPNSSNPRPQPDDLYAADKFGVPVFTITSHGMFAYDPFLKRTAKVKDGLDWLDPSKWAEAYARQQRGR